MRLDRLLQLAERVQLMMLLPNRINPEMTSRAITAQDTTKRALVIRANKEIEKIRLRMIKLSRRWLFLIYRDGQSNTTDINERLFYRLHNDINNSMETIKETGTTIVVVIIKWEVIVRGVVGCNRFGWMVEWYLKTVNDNTMLITASIYTEFAE